MTRCEILPDTSRTQVADFAPSFAFCSHTAKTTMRMFSVVLCFLATMTVASAGRLISPSDLGLPFLSDAPDFCHGLECPPFKLLKNTSQYQLREYEGGRTYDLSYYPISYLLILLTAHCHSGLCHTGDDVCRVNVASLLGLQH